MADGKVTILVDVDGKKVQVANQQLDQMKLKSQSLGKALSDTDNKFNGAFKDSNGRWRAANGRFLSMKEQSEMLGKSFDNLGQKSSKISGMLSKIALGAAAFKLASAGVDLLKNSLDGAIRRYDTLQKFPRVMKAMGHSTEDVTKATDKLASGIEGLPTTLDEVVGTAQRLTSVTGNLRKSTDLTLALNNAFLASGASSEEASRGLQQFVQMLSSGKVDLQSWHTLQETMPYALQQTAESFGFAGKSAQNDFYGALRDGRISFDQFSNKLIELSGGVGGFAELAKENSKGIATSFGNLKNAVVKGVAGTIAALDELSKAATGRSIAENFDSLKVIINASFKAINAGIKATAPIVKALFVVFQWGIGIIQALTPVLYGLAAGFATMKVLTAIVASVKAFALAWTLSAAALSASGSAMALTTAVLKVGTNAERTALAVRFAYVGLTKAWAFAQGVLTGAIGLSTIAIKLSTAATIASTVAVTALKVALTALTGPIGWVIAGVSALVAAGVALWSWLTKESEETKRLKAEQEELVNSNKALADSVSEGIRSRKENRESIQGNSQAYKKLSDEIVALSQKERLSAGEKRLLQQKIDSLNGSIEGLNLAYDKNTGKLSHNTEQLHARIDAMEAEATLKTTQQDLLDIENKRAEIQTQLGEIAQQRTKWNEEANVSDGVRKEKLAELTEQEDMLKTKLGELQTEYEATAQVQQAAADAMALAAEDGSSRQVIAYENLSQKQQAVVDNMRSKFQELQDTTTNMFDAIEQKSALSVDQMMANLEQNRLATEQWANNLQILANRGVDQGILEELRKMGPEGAAQTQVFVDSTDAELQALQESWRSNAETAKNAMGEVIDSAGVEMPGKVKSMVTDIASGMQDEIAAADFPSIGQEVPNGAAEGIDAGADKAGQASKRVAEKVKDLFKADLGIHSPSRVFKEYGGNVTEGLSNGLSNGTSKVMSSMKKLQSQMVQIGQQIVQNMKQKSQQIVQALGHMGPGMHANGVHAMQGLANGIYAGSGSAIAAAQHVASMVKSTIQSALAIHSPSRVMRDEVGRFIPQGIAVGIEADSHVIDKSMQALRDSMVLSASPEKASGVLNGGVLQVRMLSERARGGQVKVIQDNPSQERYDTSLEKALYLVEKALERPVEMRFDDDTLIAKTVDKFSKALDRQAQEVNRMWGRI